jgi:hypothetical protein
MQLNLLAYAPGGLCQGFHTSGSQPTVINFRAGKLLQILSQIS